MRALEAAEAARKREEERAAERAKQRLEIEKQRQERMKVLWRLAGLHRTALLLAVTAAAALLNMQ